MTAFCPITESKMLKELFEAILKFAFCQAVAYIIFSHLFNWCQESSPQGTKKQKKLQWVTALCLASKDKGIKTPPLLVEKWRLSCKRAVEPITSPD